MNKNTHRKTNWNALAAFGNTNKFKNASNKNNQPCSVIKQNNRAGKIGRAGLIKSSIEDGDKDPKLFHKRNRQEEL